jgi:pimeloyl-ACP methyl ester carboxylesterase
VTLVLLHGFSDSPRTWEKVLPLLGGGGGVVVAPALPAGVATGAALVDAVDALLPAGLLDLAGNSLGGWLALKLAERGRARSVVAFAPAGGWAAGDGSYRDLLRQQRGLPGASQALIDDALREGWPVVPERITCPVRVVWGTADPLLPWPAAAARYRTEWLPHADWVELAGVGHHPQLEVPLEAAQLILGFTSR